ncbi:MAG: diguanylate cyclase [Gammaproteobacteria bacterium]|nr:diguanylate cyclase [Gammaproteobacteria bacterium]
MTTNTTARCLPAFAGLLLTLLSFSGLASAATFEPNTMHFDRISVADGLAQSSVMAIVQDQSGFLWFATESGLDRYDGFTFKHYRHERGNPNALASDFVRDLDLADDGSLWIATDGGGVSLWTPATDSITTYRHVDNDLTSLATDHIRTILVGEDGNIWIGTRDSGLDRLDPSTGTVTHHVNEPDNSASLSSDEIFALAIDGSGAVWIGTKAGLNRLDAETGQITRVPLDPENPDSLADNSARSLLIGHDGALWIGTDNGGLIRYDAEARSARRYGHDPSVPGTLSSNRVEVIFEDDRNRLWVGTDKGLNMMAGDSGKFAIYKNDPANPSSISGDSIFSIFQDRGGLIWIGTRTGDLNKWNPRSWSFGHFKPELRGPLSFSNLNITSFTEDNDGNTWVGTFGGGINIIDRSGQSVTQMRSDRRDSNTIGDDRVMALITDRRGKIWAGTMRGGLSKIDPFTGEVKTYRKDRANPNSLAANGVMSILQDSAGYIWAGTFGGGVSRLDPENDEITNFEHDPNDSTSLSSPRATTIAEGRDGVIWVGTDGGGLNYFDSSSGEWRHLKHDLDDTGSLSADTIYSLHVDARGTLWVGSRQGLDRVAVSQSSNDGTRVVDVSMVEGMNRTAVYGVQSDSLGNLWISSAQGLVRYNPATGQIRDFHKSQGLQGEEFTAGANYRSPNGKLYFGGANGFNMFDPAAIELNTQAPPVVLTSLSIINEPVKTDQPYERIRGLDLDYSDHVVTFGISALDFTAPKENRYAYMLEGFDDTWVDAGNERRITYTNLDGGRYVLKVRAANSDGVWNENGVEIPINVAFAPWKTWWAYTLYVGAFFAAIFGLWRQQERKLQREFEYSRRLEKEVEGRTQELNNRNTDLKIANRKLQDASTTDALTGLRNRRHLFQQVDKDVDLVLRHYRDGTETMRPDGNNDLLFLMVDLDNFKPVNDSCGHEAGDRLLLQVRDVLLEACRKTDDVIRWGGDEFLIVARETNRKYAATLAERVRDSLSDRVFPVGDGQVARVTSSIGYASYPFLKERPDLLTWEEVLGVADAAMYEAKQKRNAWTGIEGLEWAGTGDELYRAIKSEPGVLAEEGAIRAIESVQEVAEGIA